MMQFKCIRTSFLVISVAQLVAVFERQIFDFMGYMWLCIGCNFLHVICIILGIFGALQHRACYIVMVVVWNLLWIAWNAFIVCLYLDVGVLQKEMQILNLGTRTPNWWHVNGPGCAVTYNFSAVDPVTFRAQIVRVDNCILEYYYIEVIQSALQAALCVGSILCGIILLHLYRGKDALSLEEALKPVPVPGYTLSLQHSVLDTNAPFLPAKPHPNSSDSSYETVPRSLPSHHSQRNETRRSSKNGSTTQRTLTKNRRSSSHDGIGFRDRSTRAPPHHAHDPNGIVAVTHPFGVRREVNLAVRPHPLYVPSSVSPYPSRAETEVSF